MFSNNWPASCSIMSEKLTSILLAPVAWTKLQLSYLPIPWASKDQKRGKCFGGNKEHTSYSYSTSRLISQYLLSIPTSICNCHLEDYRGYPNKLSSDFWLDTLAASDTSPTPSPYSHPHTYFYALSKFYRFFPPCYFLQWSLLPESYLGHHHLLPWMITSHCPSTHCYQTSSWSISLITYSCSETINGSPLLTE